MYWEDDPSEKPTRAIEEVVELHFRLEGRTLPVDHADPLHDRLRELFPWFDTEPLTALQLIQAAASGNGWYSPEDGSGGPIYLSRRSKLILRVPAARAQEVAGASGADLGFGEPNLRLGAARQATLSPVTTLYARYLVDEAEADEPRFLAGVAERLAAMGVVCSKSHHLTLVGARRQTRSLMLANLTAEGARKLLVEGLGDYQRHGCGVFIPHKDIREVAEV